MSTALQDLSRSDCLIFDLGIVNVRRFHHNHVITGAGPNRNAANGLVIVGRENILEPKEHQLFRIVLVQTMLYIICKCSIQIMLLYNEINKTQKKSAEQRSIEDSVLHLTYFIYFVENCVGCYVNLIVSKTFRKAMKSTLFKLCLPWPGRCMKWRDINVSMLWRKSLFIFHSSPTSVPVWLTIELCFTYMYPNISASRVPTPIKMMHPNVTDKFWESFGIQPQDRLCWRDNSHLITLAAWSSTIYVILVLLMIKESLSIACLLESNVRDDIFQWD